MSVGGVHRQINVIFRRFGLFPGVAVHHGVVLTPMRLKGVAHRRTSRGTARLLSHVKLLSGTSYCPSDLSNKRGRHMTVIHTLTVGPRILLFSRPASTLSPRVMKRMLRLVGSITTRNVAVIMMARRVNFTQRITGHILFFDSNCVARSNAPRRIFGRPGSPELRRFLNGILWDSW